ncbi:carbohydrate binding protein with CBM6 domain [Saccharothrix carnea]|uniref:Carbohydrate binding protein with CBM6 domain n=1 Tax=Saccharothrix carnea TaxID=1280637 RepID=A0A2P8IF58_SACCR|nr:family 43 glycosylhydrolase [Saccharothrix carnea]PSL57080.1 carbohydrate binding protein with CBM6 domain [Saccharothrix carnea]
MTRTPPTPVKRRVLAAAVLLFASVLTPQSVTAAAQPVTEAAPVTAVHPAAQDAPGIEDAADDPHGLKKTVADYRTRIPTKYTTDSWKPFAKALTTADDVAKNPSANATEAAAAKTALVTAAGDLEAADEGTFQTITNNTFWNDTGGNPIYSQGGGVFKFGDTYYWYGVHYRGAESYRANPTRKYDGEVSFVSIPVYSSRDLVNWKFENRVATRSTAIHNGNTMASTGWVGRLGVAYNENTGKYVLATQAYVGGAHGVLLLQGNTPTSNFTYGYFQGQVVNSPTTGTGDQTVFTDEDGKDYLIFSNREGRSRGFVSKFRESDSLRIEPGVQIRSGSGREGNAMFKLDGRYYHAASDLHGWNTSVNYVNESTSSNIQGTYSSEYVLAGTEMDYSHVTQTGFFVTVKGTKQNTVIYAGDRWADFAWNGIGYNQWVPITKTGARPQFHSVSQWQFNVTTGEWRVGPDNNYILNPDIQADRIIVSSVRGWRNLGGSVTNVNGGVNGSRFALQVSNSGGVEQRIESVPAGTYTLSSHARGSAGQVVITGANGSQRTLSLPSSSGWAKRELTGITLPSGAATVTVRASGSGGVIVDQLSLVRTEGGTPTGQRYEAETAPAVCQGTIDSNQAGFTGTGFCNGTAAVGAYAQFTVDAAQAGPAALAVRFANGSSSGAARPANLVVNGSTIGTVSFEATGAWTTWSTKSFTAPLNAGSNTIRLEPTATEGLPNVDHLDVGVVTG